jgi:hypothetical protein
MNKLINSAVRICLQVFFLFVFLNPVVIDSAFAKSVKSPEQAAGALWQQSIELFIRSRNKLPRSWNDLNEVEASRYCIKVIDSDIPEFRSRYRFLASDKIPLIELSDRKMRLIAMGITTRAPGARNESAQKVRSVILVSDANRVEHTTLTETELNYYLEKAGVELKDFTGPDGKWENESAVEEQSKNINHNDKSVANHDSVRKINEKNDNLFLEHNSALAKFYSKFAAWMVLLGILLLVGGVFLKSKKLI